jgi:O-antigen/teichoic acid export membrane protein
LTPDGGAGRARGDLVRDARRGVAWSALALVGAALLSLLQLSVAARFLARSEFGLMALVLVVVGFCQGMADLGTANAVLHRQRASRGELASLFWASLAVGVLLGAGVAAAGPALAAAWGEPALARWLLWIAPVFPFLGAAQVPMACLRRDLRFGAFAALELGSAAAGTAAVCALAVAGAGVGALVAGQLAVAAARCALALRLARYRPAPHFSRAELAPFLSFGLYQMGERLVSFAARNLDKLVIGVWLGTAALGAYSLAYQLVNRPFRLLSNLSGRVARPLLARVQHDHERLLGAYLESVRIAALTAFPLYVCAWLLAEPLVALVYGPGWGDVASLFRILWPLGMLYAIGNPVGALVVATGRARIGFVWNAFCALVDLAAVAIGVAYGAQGVAVALVVATAGVIFPCGFAMRWALAEVPPGPFLAQLARPLAYAALAGLAVVAAGAGLPALPAPLELLLPGGIGAAVYLALLFARERALLLALRGS